MRLDETNSVVQTPWLYLYPIKSYSPKQLWWPQMTFRGGTLRRISAFLSTTFDWIETQTWEWHQNVCLAKAHRLIYNMTYLNHHVTLTWDDLRSNFEIDLSRSSSICFEPARRENHIDVNPRPTGGGAISSPPSGFLAISSKPMQVSPPNLQYPLSQQFYTLC